MTKETVQEKQRRESLERYYANPNICLSCKKIIAVTKKNSVFETKKKKFCDYVCAARFNNAKFKKREKIRFFYCSNCGKNIRNDNKRCMKCHTDLILKNNLNKTIKDYVDSSKKTILKAPNAKFNGIRTLARKILEVFEREKKCIVCKYDNFRILEVCHIRPIIDFEKEAKVKDVNALDNLEYLCPTHHKEFDKVFLDITKYRSDDQWKMDEFLKKEKKESFGLVA